MYSARAKAQNGGDSGQVELHGAVKYPHRLNLYGVSPTLDAFRF
jgi:hypothetical protein